MSAQTRVDHLQQEPSQQTGETLSASSRYINMRAPGVAAASWNSVEAPAIREHVAYGEDQGGILDWFRSLFGRHTDDAQQETDQPQQADIRQPLLQDVQQQETDQPQHDIQPLQPQQNTQPQNPPAPEQNEQIPAAPHTKGDTWGTTESVVQYAVTLPLTTGGKVIRNLARPFSEELKMKPVFESHAFMPNSDIDEESMWSMHSFIGLRFTTLDKKTKRLERKVTRVGFGGGGSARAAGRLMDDYYTQADMSTETPIDAGHFLQVVEAVGRVADNADRIRHGRSQEGEFSGRYNLLTNNCNDFVEKMATVAGAEVPARLHHSILGPGGAYLQLAEAAEGGMQGETRFFQGGSSALGQMSESRREDFLMNFRAEAERALGVDGIRLSDAPEMASLVDRVAGDAAVVAGWLTGSASAPETDDEKQLLRDTLNRVSRDVRELVEYRYTKSHGRLNISAMKVEALAGQVRETYLPAGKRQFADLTRKEKAAALTVTTGEETHASTASTGLENRALFDPHNFRDSQLYSPWAVGDTFLLAVGIDDVEGFIKGHSGRSVEIPRDILMHVIERIQAGGEDFIECLRMFTGARGTNTPRQNAMLIEHGILARLGMQNLGQAQ
ncbi:MAG: hypothetical protein IJT34_02990, partial [Butyrivibrio sp.]|nr:hypothetical protein [Butyrivibrio sp.]